MDDQMQKQSNRSGGLPCYQSPVGKWAFPVFIAFFGFIFITGIVPVHPIVIIMLALLAPYSLVSSPDFTVYDDGIQIHFPWREPFITWDEIRRVRKTSVNARIYAPRLTVFNVIFSLGKSWFIITAPGRKNYEEALDIIKFNIGDRFHELRY